MPKDYEQLTVEERVEFAELMMPRLRHAGVEISMDDLLACIESMDGLVCLRREEVRKLTQASL